MLRGQEILDSLVFKPFQCCTPLTDDLAEGFVGFRSSLGPDWKAMPFEWKCFPIPLVFLMACQTFAKGDNAFSSPSLFFCIRFYLFCFITTHKFVAISAHAARKLRAGFACLSLSQPCSTEHPCKAGVEVCWYTEIGGGGDGFPFSKPFHAGSLADTSAYKATSTKEGMRNLCTSPCMCLQRCCAPPKCVGSLLS